MISNVKTTTAIVSVFKSREGRQRILEQYDKILKTFDFEYREQYVDTSYGPTYVLESGSHDLPPLFLFHGSSSNSAAWFADIKALTQHHHVIAVDLIGDAGHSAENRLDMKSDGYALWIRELFDGLSIAGSVDMPEIRIRFPRQSVENRLAGSFRYLSGQAFVCSSRNSLQFEREKRWRGNHTDGIWKRPDSARGHRVRKYHLGELFALYWRITGLSGFGYVPA